MSSPTVLLYEAVRPLTNRNECTETEEARYKLDDWLQQAFPVVVLPDMPTPEEWGPSEWKKVHRSCLECINLCRNPEAKKQEHRAALLDIDRLAAEFEAQTL